MLASPRLSATVEAVEFGMSFHGSVIKVIVLACDLREVFGAGPRPAQWLASFESNKRSIRWAARLRYRLTGAKVFVLPRAELEASRYIQQH